MKNYIKFALGLTMASASIYAAQPAETPEIVRTKSDVYLSAPSHYFDIEFTALVLQPTASNTHYAAEAFPIPAPTPNWEIYDINPDYHFGFNIAIGGISHCTNSDLRANWKHFHSTDSDSVSIPRQDMIGPFFEIGPDESPYKSAKGHVTFHFDQANLVSGMFLNVGDRLKTHFFGGINFARVKETLSSYYADDSRSISRSVTVPSLFSGAGPQLGVDFCYQIVKGFHLTGGGSTSLLVGPQKNSTTFKSYSPDLAGLGITPPNFQTTTGHQKTQVVPGFEGKLGLSYCFNFCDHYMVKLEAGYEAEIYLNAIQSVDLGSQVIGLTDIEETTGVYARTFQQVLSNFALAGPYFTVVLGF